MDSQYTIGTPKPETTIDEETLNLELQLARERSLYLKNQDSQNDSVDNKVNEPSEVIPEYPGTGYGSRGLIKTRASFGMPLAKEVEYLNAIHNKKGLFYRENDGYIEWSKDQNKWNPLDPSGYSLNPKSADFFPKEALKDVIDVIPDVGINLFAAKVGKMAGTKAALSKYPWLQRYATALGEGSALAGTNLTGQTGLKINQLAGGDLGKSFQFDWKSPALDLMLGAAGSTIFGGNLTEKQIAKIAEERAARVTPAQIQSEIAEKIYTSPEAQAALKQKGIAEKEAFKNKTLLNQGADEVGQLLQTIFGADKNKSRLMKPNDYEYQDILNRDRIAAMSRDIAKRNESPIAKVLPMLGELASKFHSTLSKGATHQEMQAYNQMFPKIHGKNIMQNTKPTEEASFVGQKIIGEVNNHLNFIDEDLKKIRNTPINPMDKNSPKFGDAPFNFKPLHDEIVNEEKKIRGKEFLTPADHQILDTLEKFKLANLSHSPVFNVKHTLDNTSPIPDTITVNQVQQFKEQLRSLADYDAKWQVEADPMKERVAKIADRLLGKIASGVNESLEKVDPTFGQEYAKNHKKLNTLYGEVKKRKKVLLDELGDPDVLGDDFKLTAYNRFINVKDPNTDSLINVLNKYPKLHNTIPDIERIKVTHRVGWPGRFKKNVLKDLDPSSQYSSNQVKDISRALAVKVGSNSPTGGFLSWLFAGTTPKQVAAQKRGATTIAKGVGSVLKPFIYEKYPEKTVGLLSNVLKSPKGSEAAIQFAEDNLRFNPMKVLYQTQLPSISPWEQVPLPQNPQDQYPQ